MAEVTLEGIDQLAADFARMATDPGLAAQLRAVGEQALQPAAGAARSAMPHDSGQLAGGVTVKPNKWGATMTSHAVYAGPVDFGGYPGERPYLAGGRYMFPAARSVAGTVQSRYEAGVQRALDSYSWSNPAQ